MFVDYGVQPSQGGMEIMHETANDVVYVYIYLYIHNHIYINIISILLFTYIYNYICIYIYNIYIYISAYIGMQTDLYTSCTAWAHQMVGEESKRRFFVWGADGKGLALFLSKTN